MKVLNNDQRAELLQLEAAVDRALLSIFKLIHNNEELGDGKLFNSEGLKKQDQYLKASNNISKGFKALKQL